MSRAWVFRSVAGSAPGVLVGIAVLAVFLAGDSLRAAQEPDATARAAVLTPELADLVAAHNRERAAQKLEPLAANAKLSAAALSHARDMAEHEKMDHEGSDGSKFNERIERQGYNGRRMAENIAWGHKNVELVMREWMGSEHHRENI